MESTDIQILCFMGLIGLFMLAWLLGTYRLEMAKSKRRQKEIELEIAQAERDRAAENSAALVSVIVASKLKEKKAEKDT